MKRGGSFEGIPKFRPRHSTSQSHRGQFNAMSETVHLSTAAIHRNLISISASRLPTSHSLGGLHEEISIVHHVQ